MRTKMTGVISRAKEALPDSVGYTGWRSVSGRPTLTLATKGAKGSSLASAEEWAIIREGHDSHGVDQPAKLNRM